MTYLRLQSFLAISSSGLNFEVFSSGTLWARLNSKNRQKTDPIVVRLKILLNRKRSSFGNKCLKSIMMLMYAMYVSVTIWSLLLIAYILLESRRKCYSCLLGMDREEAAAIILGIKVIILIEPCAIYSNFMNRSVLSERALDPSGV